MGKARVDLNSVTTVGLDLAKHVFQIHAVDADGRVVIAAALRRKDVLSFFGALPRCLVGLEACGSAHHWARELIKLGHDARLMPPNYVTYVMRVLDGSRGIRRRLSRAMLAEGSERATGGLEAQGVGQGRCSGAAWGCAAGSRRHPVGAVVCGGVAGCADEVCRSNATERQAGLPICLRRPASERWAFKRRGSGPRQGRRSMLQRRGQQRVSRPRP
jgi:hypothetical protein